MRSNTDANGRTTVTRTVAASTTAVWDVLSDGWFYATWVVGAARVRDVDATWPGAGARLHHSFGAWPAMVNDETTVIQSTPEQSLILQAKGWPMGEARVEMQLVPAEGACVVSIVEDAVRGPGLLVPQVIRQALIAPRNREALRRLALLAEGRAAAATNGP